MPDMEEIKRKAQNAAYTATEKAQDAAAAAGEKTVAILGYAGEKAEALKGLAGGKAGAFISFAGEKAEAIRDAAVSGMTVMSERRSLEKNYQALGEWYAAQCGEDAPEAVADIVRAIHASQKKIAELRERGAKESEADAVPEEAPAAEASAPDGKTEE